MRLALALALLAAPAWSTEVAENKIPPTGKLLSRGEAKKMMAKVQKTTGKSATVQKSMRREGKPGTSATKGQKDALPLKKNLGALWEKEHAADAAEKLRFVASEKSNKNAGTSAKHFRMPKATPKDASPVNKKQQKKPPKPAIRRAKALSYSYSHDDDCTAQYQRLFCMGSTLYHGECGDSCGSDCSMTELPEQYSCDSENYYYSDEDGVEHTGSLPFTDADGCYYNDCDDDDDDDDCAVGWKKSYCVGTQFMHASDCGSDSYCSEDCPSIDYTALSNGHYYCNPNDSLMVFIDEDRDGTPDGSMTLPPGGCYYDACDDGSYSYSHDDCSVGYVKMYCEEHNLWRGDCGDSCSDNCAVYDFTEFSGGKYKCNDSGMIEVDENLDGIVENTISLPTDENGCYYEDCDDDDNDDATCEDGSYTGYEKWFCDTSHTDDMGNGNLYHGICGDSCSDHYCHTYDFTEATGGMYYCNIYSPGFGIIDSGYNVPYYYYLPEADESGCSYSECEDDDGHHDDDGHSLCEGHGFDETQCVEQSPCCEWDDDQCWFIGCGSYSYSHDDGPGHDNNWDVPPGTVYHGDGNGWCRSDLDSYQGDFDTPDQCWEWCVMTYGDMVAAIELNGYGGSCYCQSSCDCMAEGGDDQMVLTRDWITSLPSECEDDDGDCTAGYAKIKCVGTILYHAECGEWCSDECMFRDFTAETGGMYYCDISDPFTYIYDADLDGIPEDTGALPVLDANGCYYDNCDDDDDEDDYNHPCLEDCDNQCMSDLSCLEDCPIGSDPEYTSWFAHNACGYCLYYDHLFSSYSYEYTEEMAIEQGWEDLCAPYPEGWCYTEDSTVMVRETIEAATANKGATRNTSTVVPKQLKDVKVGDEILKKPMLGVSGSASRSRFTKVLAVPSSPTTQPLFEIATKAQQSKLRGNTPKQTVKATAHHTFLRCVARAAEAGGKDPKETLVMAKDVEAGDCLQTASGNHLVSSVKNAKKTAPGNSWTYSVVTEGGSKDLISVGGLLAHATDMKRLAGGSNGTPRNVFSFGK